MTEFRNKVAVVTGGSSGIGRAVVARLARAGAAVVFLGHAEDDVRATERELATDGRRVNGLVGDVTRPADVQRLVLTAQQRYGGLTTVVNSAGIQRYGTVEDTDLAEWDEVLSVNLTGAFLTCKYALPSLRAGGGGAIVNVSSIQAFVTQSAVAAYTVSKAGLNALTRSLAIDYAPHHVRANVVCPASVDTPMLRWAAEKFRGDNSAEDVLRSWGGMHPLGRCATADEVAEAVAFLASDRASFITGEELRVDGGLLAAAGVALPDESGPTTGEAT